MVPATKNTTDSTPKAVRLHCKQFAGDLSFELARTLYACLEQTGHRVEFLSMPEGTSQANLLSVPEPANLSPPGTVPPTIRVVAKLARTYLPDTVDVEVVTLEVDPIGTAAVPVERLLGLNTGKQSLQLAETLGTQLLETVIERSNPHLVQLVVRPPTDALTVSLRLCEIRPETQAFTRDDEAAARYRDDQRLLSDHLESATVTTNRDLLETCWTVRVEDRLSGPPQPLLEIGYDSQGQPEQSKAVFDVARTPTEYERFFTRAPGPSLQDRYRDLEATPWLRLNSEQLPAVCGLQPATYTRPPWKTVSGRDGPIVRPVSDTSRPTRQSPVTARAEQLCETVTADTDQQFIRQALQWLLEQGDRIQPVTTPSVLVPTFRRERPTGETTLLLLISESAVPHGEIVTAAREATAQTDGMTVLTASLEAGREVVHTLLEPIDGSAETSFPATRLYDRSCPLIGKREIAVRSRDSPPINWAVTPGVDGDLLAIRDGELVGTWPRTISNTDLVRSFQQLIVGDDELRLVDPNGMTRRSYASKAEMNAELRPVFEPARPGTLADGLESATVFARRGSQFEEVRLTASWDQRMSMNREREAGQAFLEQFTVTDITSRLPLDEAVPQFASWVRHQTDSRLSASLGEKLRTAYRKHTGPTHFSKTSIISDRKWIYQPFSAGVTSTND